MAEGCVVLVVGGVGEVGGGEMDGVDDPVVGVGALAEVGGVPLVSLELVPAEESPSWETAPDSGVADAPEAVPAESDAPAGVPVSAALPSAAASPRSAWPAPALSPRTNPGVGAMPLPFTPAAGAGSTRSSSTALTPAHATVTAAAIPANHRKRKPTARTTVSSVAQIVCVVTVKGDK